MSTFLPLQEIKFCGSYVSEDGRSAFEERNQFD